MPLTTISTRRSLTSYSRVQRVLGDALRNRAFQLSRPRARDLVLLDIGCGPNTHEHMLNLDYLWRPGIDVCWDISRGLPFATGRFEGVFSEHCLEHFHLDDAVSLLKEMKRVLAPGGTLRLVVPDAERYIRTYLARRDGDPTRLFPFEPPGHGDESWRPISHVNRVFYQDRRSPHGHCTMFDLDLLEYLLTAVGFADVQGRQFRQGRDPRLCVDTISREPESLYVEAVA